MFLKFINFYYYFIQDLSKITTLFTLILKIIILLKNSLVLKNITKENIELSDNKNCNKLIPNFSKFKKTIMIN